MADIFKGLVGIAMVLFALVYFLLTLFAPFGIAFLVFEVIEHHSTLETLL